MTPGHLKGYPKGQTSLPLPLKAPLIDNKISSVAPTIASSLMRHKVPQDRRNRSMGKVFFQWFRLWIMKWMFKRRFRVVLRFGVVTRWIKYWELRTLRGKFNFHIETVTTDANLFSIRDSPKSKEGYSSHLKNQELPLKIQNQENL